VTRLRWSVHYQGSFSSEWTLIGRVVSSVCGLQIAWRFGDASSPLTRRRWSVHYQGSFSSECTLNGRVVSSVCGLQIAWRFGDASGPEPGLALRIQSHGFGYPFDALALDFTIINSDFEMYGLKL